jgi:NAD(P)-dependent dehydrogenase (short-subunit alcohol dehydrogenase family)
MRFAAEEMRRHGGGSIVNVASVSSVIAQPRLLTYNASKGAVIQLTRCAALDLAPDGIRVNCVCPGLVWTEQVKKLAAEAGWTKEQAEAEFGPMQILKRSAEPREIAYAILFLASDESSFCIGSALFVDGGWTTQ